MKGLIRCQILKFSLEKFQIYVFAQTWIRCVICHVSFFIGGKFAPPARQVQSFFFFFFWGGGEPWVIFVKHKNKKIIWMLFKNNSLSICFVFFRKVAPQRTAVSNSYHLQELAVCIWINDPVIHTLLYLLVRIKSKFTYFFLFAFHPNRRRLFHQRCV